MLEERRAYPRPRDETFAAPQPVLHAAVLPAYPASTAGYGFWAACDFSMISAIVTRAPSRRRLSSAASMKA